MPKAKMKFNYWKKLYEQSQVELIQARADRTVVTDTFRDAAKKLIELEKQVLDIYSDFGKTKEENLGLKARIAIADMRIMASKPELNFWQAKAEQLISEFISTGTIHPKTITSDPGIP